MMGTSSQVNLICVEDRIDSSKAAGKPMISVLSAVAEIERENIRVQTVEGRSQKARERKWNGGFAPYGYRLIEGKQTMVFIKYSRRKTEKVHGTRNEYHLVEQDNYILVDGSMMQLLRKMSGMRHR